MVYEGARGDTAKEIQSVFHFPEDNDPRRNSAMAIYNQLNKKDAKYELYSGNALWIQKDYKLLDEYTGVVKKYYDGSATNVDFVGDTEGARKTINDWVEDKTKDKIKDFFPKGSIVETSRVVLTNAVYFKGDWVITFPKEITRERLLHSLSLRGAKRRGNLITY